MDVMGTQVEIAEQIVKKKGDFVLALKGNQRHLFEDATDAFSIRQPHKQHLEQEKGHGRIDKRNYKILAAEGNLTDAIAQRWPMVKSLIRVEHEFMMSSFSSTSSCNCSTLRNSSACWSH